MSEYADWTDDMVILEIEVLQERYYDLLAQVAEARLAKAALMNTLKQRREQQK